MTEEGINHHFILGMGRSGSNLLLRILDKSESVVCVPEVPLLLHFSFDKSDKGYFNGSDIDDVKVFSEGVNYKRIFHYDFSHLESTIGSVTDYPDFVGKGLLGFKTGIKPEKGITHIIDKNPVYTFHVRRILALVPGAKFVILIRDPRAYIASSLENEDVPGKKRSFIFHACVWKEYALQIGKLLQKYPERCLLIRYEDLIGESEKNIRKICVHLNLEFNESMLLHFEGMDLKKIHKHQLSGNEEASLKGKYGQLEKPINTERIESWKDSLEENQIRQINFILRREAEYFNYPFPKLDADIRLFLDPVIIINKILVTGYFIFARMFYFLPIKLRERIRKQV